MNSETPRTNDQIGYSGSTMSLISIDFARTLERELSEARRENAELRQRASDHGDFIGFMTDALGGFPCCHEGGQHHSTPPMMWPELIACIVKKATQESVARAEAAEAMAIRLTRALEQIEQYPTSCGVSPENGMKDIATATLNP